MKPVNGNIGTPYGKRGSYWSCNKDASGNGIHTGVDFPASTGTPMYAARPGTLRYCNHGSAFGYHQFEIMPGDGTRDFYAHASKRTVADGAKVEAGQKVGEVGAEGNVTGPHLHFERHKVASGGWSCSIVTNPQPSIDWQPSGGGGGGSSSGGDDPMPKHVRGTTSQVKLNGDWQLITWEKMSGDAKDVAAAGNPGFTFVGPYVASISLSLDVPDASTNGKVVQTRAIEGNFGGKGGEWQITQTLMASETVVTGTTPHVDCRAQALAKGDKLRFQVRGPKGATAKSLAVSVFYWT